MEENLNLFCEFFVFLFLMCGFKLVFLNIVSLFKYIDELRVLFFDNFFDILFINEMRFDDFISDDEVYIFGYDIICCDCEYNGRFGGGVCIYV